MMRDTEGEHSERLPQLGSVFLRAGRELDLL